MKTKGINSEQDIAAYKRENKICNQQMEEFFMKGMMLSCYTYGGIGRASWNFERYLKGYKDELGEKVFEEVYKEQSEYLEQFSVQHGVYTDREGCSYNSLIKN